MSLVLLLVCPLICSLSSAFLPYASLSAQPKYGGGAGSAAAGEPSEWKEKHTDYYASEPPADKYPDIYSNEPPADDQADLGASAISLEGTVQVVKENMWYIGDAALKSVAEVLYGFGISPTILGYTEEELLEEDEEEEYDIAQLAVQRDEVVAKTSFAMRSEENMQRRKTEEPAPPVDEAEEVYMDQGNDGWGGEEDYIEFVEDKKDK
ncbi:unnamed protein product [Closterium sp. Naga37s-1]|nr:unnamed protein product [Closterium sp. Naga37s-1]